MIYRKDLERVLTSDEVDANFKELDIKYSLTSSSGVIATIPLTNGEAFVSAHLEFINSDGASGTIHSKYQVNNDTTTLITSTFDGVDAVTLSFVVVTDGLEVHIASSARGAIVMNGLLNTITV